MMLPRTYRHPAKQRPTDECVTVISGERRVGMTHKLDTGKGEQPNAGRFAVAPAEMNADQDRCTGRGARTLGMTYLDPADDPTKK